MCKNKEKNKKEYVEIINKAETNPDDPGYFDGGEIIIPRKKKEKSKDDE